MSFRDIIDEDLKKSLREKNEHASMTLRMLLSELHNHEIEERKKEVGLADEEVIHIIQKEVKKRNDAIAEYRKAGRNDLAEKEEQESALLKKYLPPELDEEEIRRVVESSVREVNAGSTADFGKVMKAAMASLKGKASGERVGKIVRDALAQL